VTPNVQLVDHNLYKKTKQALMQKAPAIAKAIVMNRLVPPNMLAVVICNSDVVFTWFKIPINSTIKFSTGG
jgi:hypothetical protein